MAMRMSGLMSGMDTESIVQQLVEAKSVKVTTAKKAQTKLSWKQDAWKDLNTKLKNLQSKFLSNMRFSTSYTRKVTKVSNPNAVSVITGENAVNGVQELEISQLAKTGYLTGGKVTTGDGGEAVTALTKISDLKQVDEDGNVIGSFSGSGRINVTAGNTSVDINIIEDKTTISDVLSQLKAAGLNASFDAKWRRFSISSKESGADNDFSITALDDNGEKALGVMQLQVDLNDDKATLAEYQKYAKYYVAGDRNATVANMQGMIDKDVASRTEAYRNQYKSLVDSRNAAQKTVDEIDKKYADKGVTLDTPENYKTQIESKNARIEELNKKLNEAGSPLTDAERELAEKELAQLQDEVKNLSEQKADAESLAANQENITKLNGQIADVEQYVTITTGTGANNETTYEAVATAKLTTEVEDRYIAKAEKASRVIAEYEAAQKNPPADSNAKNGGATKVSGQDAVITLNGATYENSNNTFEINGLTFTALAETKDAPITVTTEQDVDGIYDMVKNFLKEYNSIINEMDKLYNADAAKDYEPLSDEEKDVMSEKDIEKYEQKIKDSLLRRDENLSSVSSGLRDVMAAGIEVNGKTMHLFDFGIETLSYFVAPDNEKNAYHIAGDADDGYTSGNEDKLKTMIANDPDTVIDFFTKLSQNLYGKMSDMSKSVDGYRSFGNFYDDKKMKSDYDDYTSKIATLEQKLNDYEDSWYKKFSAMETAMAKMQQNANAVTSLLGG